MVLSQTPTRHNLTFAKATDPILAAADRAEPKIRRAILAAYAEMQRAVPDLESLIASGRIDAVIGAVQPLGLPQAFLDTLASATASAAVSAVSSEAATINIAFNEPNRRAIRWAEQHAATLVTGNVDTTAIRRLVVNATEKGIHPRVTARLIREIVPILPRHQATVERLFTSSIDAGVTEAHAEKVAARKAKRLLRYRAEMIARTEAMTAANQGQLLVWETAVDLDLIPAGTKRVVLATGDDRTCPICAVMDGKTVSIQGSLTVDRQATGFVRSGSTFRVSGTKPLKNPHTVRQPPFHPQCRCRTVLEHIPAP